MCSPWPGRDGLVRKLRNSFPTVKSRVRAYGDIEREAERSAESRKL